MKKSILIFTCLIILLFSSALFAEDKHPIDIEEEKCLNKDLTTAGMANCSYEAREKWDKELNRYYKLLFTVLNEQKKAKLKESQLAWIKFRDLEFENIENMYPQDASMYIPIRQSDKSDIVKQRALQLKAYYEALKER